MEGLVIFFVALLSGFLQEVQIIRLQVLIINPVSQGLESMVHGPDVAAT